MGPSRAQGLWPGPRGEAGRGRGRARVPITASNRAARTRRRASTGRSGRQGRQGSQAARQGARRCTPTPRHPRRGPGWLRLRLRLCNHQWPVVPCDSHTALVADLLCSHWRAWRLLTRAFPPPPYAGQGARVQEQSGRVPSAVLAQRLSLRGTPGSGVSWSSCRSTPLPLLGYWQRQTARCIMGMCFT